jgi:hypothetical protein
MILFPSSSFRIMYALWVNEQYILFSSCVVQSTNNDISDIILSLPFPTFLLTFVNVVHFFFRSLWFTTPTLAFLFLSLFIFYFIISCFIYFLIFLIFLLNTNFIFYSCCRLSCFLINIIIRYIVIFSSGTCWIREWSSFTFESWFDS